VALQQLGETIGQEGATARKHLTTKLPFSKLQQLARRLERAASHLNDSGTLPHAGRRAWLSALDVLVHRRSASVRSAIDAAGGVYVPQRLHNVRIALKKLRYAWEIAAEAQNLRASASLGRLKAAQDLLGRLHDLEVLVDYGRQVQASSTPPNLTTWRNLRSLVHALEDDCRRLHARYMHDRPKLIAIADRLSGTERHVQSWRASSTKSAAGRAGTAS
jgi:CHAD domain-containing protein